MTIPALSSTHASTFPHRLDRSSLRQPAARELADQLQGSDRRDAKPDEAQLREVVHQFVGQTFFSQMLSAMRKTVGEPAYVHGGRAEEVFQSQLDQVLSEQLTEASGKSLSEPIYQLFSLSRG